MVGSNGCKKNHIAVYLNKRSFVKINDQYKRMSRVFSKRVLAN